MHRELLTDYKRLPSCTGQRGLLPSVDPHCESGYMSAANANPSQLFVAVPIQYSRSKRDGTNRSMAAQQWRPHQLTDSELNREIAGQQQLLEQTPEGSRARADLESAIAAFLLEREERRRARQAAIDREVKSFPEPSMSD